MEDEALPARDALTLEPPFTFKETLGKKIVLIILDFLDEAPVQALAAAPAQHPEEGPLRGAVLQSIRLISLKTNIALEAWLNAALSWLSAAQPHLTCMQNFRGCSAL